jgi:hypothetical protein
MASQVAELDDSMFRKLEENPYTGQTEREFLKYISEMSTGDVPSDLDNDQVIEMEKLCYETAEMEEFGNSAEKGEESWFESGEVDEAYRRYGGFNVEFSSNQCDN